MGRLAGEMGFTHVSLSSEVMSMVKAVPRGFTTAADAYLTPVIARYVKSFRSGFDQVPYGIYLHTVPPPAGHNVSKGFFFNELDFFFVFWKNRTNRVEERAVIW